MTIRRHRILERDIRQLGGTITIASGRDRVTSETFFIIDHVSRGADVVFRSSPIRDEDRARKAALVLGQFCGAEVKL
jgi:hypothetical protein